MPTRKWGSERRVNTTVSGEQFQPSLAVLDDGGYVIAWTDRSGPVAQVRFQRFDSSGNPVGTQSTVPVSVSNHITEPSVVGLDGGGFAIAYDNEVVANDHDVGVARYSASGSFLGTVSIFSQGSSERDPALDRSSSGFVAAYEVNGDIYFRRWDPAGNLVGTELRVDVDDPSPAADSSADVVQLDGMYGYGRYVVTWSEHQGVYGTVLDHNGNIVAQNLLLMNESTGEARVTPLANGNFVVTTETQFGSVGVEACIFDIYGQPLGPKFDVTVPLLGHQRFADAVALADGGFAVVYLDVGTATIRGRVFDNWGARLGTEFIVSTSPARVYPDSREGAEEVSVAALSDGRLIVTWVGIDPDGSPGVRSQIIDPRDGMVNGTNAGEKLYGHDLVNDEITALAGSDTVFGMRGDDALYAGDGNDTLRGGAGGDYLDGGSGLDYADYRDSTAAVTVNLTTGLASGGFATGDELLDIERLLGSAFNDGLTGNGASNVINGGGGADLMRGMAAGDSYYVNDAGDVVDESVAGSNGTDTVLSSISFTLADTVHAKGALENLTLIGSANINGSGNGVASSAAGNVITGNAGANRLNGSFGNDTLKGLGGTDTFRFNTTINAIRNVDRITDFDVNTPSVTDSFDRIELENSVFTLLSTTGSLQTSKFASKAAADFDNGSTITYVSSTGSIYYDTNGAADGGATLFARVTAGLALTAADIFVT